MREPAHQPDDNRSEYDRFADLARRVLTTPKSDLLKHPTKKTTKQRGKKRK